MLKFANIALDFLLEFGLRYSCLSLAIDKCCLLLFDNILYIVYHKVYTIYYI
jgi:hypothetical protein